MFVKIVRKIPNFQTELFFSVSYMRDCWHFRNSGSQVYETSHQISENVREIRKKNPQSRYTPSVIFDFNVTGYKEFLHRDFTVFSAIPRLVLLLTSSIQFHYDHDSTKENNEFHNQHIILADC